MNDKIIIIGGGTGGLSMALFLEKAGIESEIYEQAPEFTEAGASYALHPNGMHVVRQLGLDKQLSKVSHALSDFKLKNKNGKIIFDLESQALDSSLFEGFIYVARHQIVDILYQEIKRKGIPIYFSKKLKSLEQDDDTVTAFFEDGTKATGSLLIGADGTHSKTRETIFPYNS